MLDTPSRKPSGVPISDAEEEPVRDANQAVVREPADALIHFTALGPRLEQIELAFIPGLQRRRQVGHQRAGKPPGESRERDPDKRKKELSDPFEVSSVTPRRLLMGNDARVLFRVRGVERAAVPERPLRAAAPPSA